MSVQDLLNAHGVDGSRSGVTQAGASRYPGEAVAGFEDYRGSVPRSGDRIGDTVVLLALGMAHRRSVTFAELVSALLDLDLPVLPCTDVVRHIVQRLVTVGALQGDLDTGAGVTDAGRRELTRILTARPDAGAGLRTALRLRMAFLDLLTAERRCLALEQVLLALEVAAEGLTAGFEDEWGGSWGGRWILRDLTSSADDIRTVRALLDDARAELGGPREWRPPVRSARQRVPVGGWPLAAE